MTEDHAAATQHAAPHDSMAHVMAGIQSLHDRLEEIENLARRVAHDGAPGASAAPVPAWRQPSEGEARWAVAVATALAIALQLPVQGRVLLVRPFWVLPAVQALLLIGIVAANPHRINRESSLLRFAALALAALLSVANAWSAVLLVTDIARGKGPTTAGPLLVTGGAIWLTNIIIFALWYWEFDQGGPAARAVAKVKRYPDFLFANMTVSGNPDLCPQGWKPSFADYLYLSFTNATAFSPTDVMPLSRWAKMAMSVQSLVSLVTVALVVARAVNVFT
jgi:hypothetical protein